MNKSFKGANNEIREALIKTNVMQWELAEKYGLSEGRFSIMMRHELAADKKKLLLSMIREIAAEKEGA